MKILLFGKNGQLGAALHKALPALGELIAVDRQSEDLCGDLSNPAGISQAVRVIQPDVIVNAAAYTATERAENEPAKARVINALAPGVLAAEARKLDALFVHYSCASVFDGSGVRSWCEEDPAHPVGAYGKTKLEGERAVRLADCAHLILRTGWLCSGAPHGHIAQILALARQHEQINLPGDEIGTPTDVELIAELTAQAITQAAQGNFACGLYHCSAAGYASWHDFAQLVVAVARFSGASLKVKQINSVPAASFSTAARRPPNARLNCSKLEQALRRSLPPWESGVVELVGRVPNAETWPGLIATDSQPR